MFLSGLLGRAGIISFLFFCISPKGFSAENLCAKLLGAAQDSAFLKEDADVYELAEQSPQSNKYIVFLPEIPRKRDPATIPLIQFSDLVLTTNGLINLKLLMAGADIENAFPVPKTIFIEQRFRHSRFVEFLQNTYIVSKASFYLGGLALFVSAGALAKGMHGIESLIPPALMNMHLSIFVMVPSLRVGSHFAQQEYLNHVQKLMEQNFLSSTDKQVLALDLPPFLKNKIIKHIRSLGFQKKSY